MTWAMPSEVWQAIQFVEAMRFLEQRVPGFRPAREAIAADAAREAFWISDVAVLSVISDVYESINRAVESGASYRSWADGVRDSLAASFPPDLSDAQVDARIGTIFRNATQRAYGTGRYQQAQEPAVKRARPYFMFDAIIDGRTTDQCRELDGVILPQDDPFWDTNTPPRHHNCRSGLRTLSRRDVAERGGPTTVPPVVETPEGFGSRPGTTPPYRPPADRYAPELTQELQRRASARGAA